MVLGRRRVTLVVIRPTHLMTDKLRQRRLADFQRRSAFAPESVYRHREYGWQYIPIHPFADEPDDLSRLQLTANDCFSVDAWWSVDGDATLLQSSVVGRGWSQPAGLYAWQTDHDLRWVYLVLIVDRDNITRVVFEHAMSQFVSLGFPSGHRFTLTRADGPVLVGGVSAASPHNDKMHRSCGGALFTLY